MNIELNLNGVSRVAQPQLAPRARQAEPVGDNADFRSTESLTQALSQLPEASPEAVKRAREVIGSVQYPPDETLDRLATLLAMHLSSQP